MLLGIALALSVLAALMPQPQYETDRDVYKRIGREIVVPDCSSLHCTRVLIAWVLEQLPGPSLLKWKTYAVLGNTAAAAGIWRLCLLFGLPAAAGRIGAVLVAMGAGAQLTLFDPYTSDPFVYALVPWMTAAMIEGRFLLAGAAGAAGVLAKEFAAAPLWIFALYGALERRGDVVIRSVLAASVATLAWLVLQLSFILVYNYSFGGNPSSQLLQGGYLARWLPELGIARAAGTLAVYFGPLFLLAAVGYPRTPRMLRHLTLAALPAALALSYVQQPDRALWNVQFVFIPLAAAALGGSAAWLVAVFLTSYGVVNLRLGPQWTALVSLPAFIVCAGSSMAIAWNAWFKARAEADAWRGPFRPDEQEPARHADAPARRRLHIGALASIVALAAGLLVALDVAVHRREESGAGVNIWGYRGPVLETKAAGEIRIVVLGGSTAFARTLEASVPLYLQDYLNNARLRGDAGYARPGWIAVVNLASPYDRVPSFRQTLEDYDSLRYDVVCLYIGHDDPVPNQDAARTGWRRQSPVFRATRYLPVLPSIVADALHSRPSEPAVAAPRGFDEYVAAVDDTVAAVLAGRAGGAGKKVIVATHPFLDEAESRRQDGVARHLRERFGANPRFEYLDLRTTVVCDNPSRAGANQPIDECNAEIAESLSQALFRLLRR